MPRRTRRVNQRSRRRCSIGNMPRPGRSRAAECFTFKAARRQQTGACGGGRYIASPDGATAATGSVDLDPGAGEASPRADDLRPAVVLRDAEGCWRRRAVIDGGKGQFSYAALEDLAWPPVAVGTPQKEELLFTRDRGGVCPSSQRPRLLLIQRIRDEAHRFA